MQRETRKEFVPYRNALISTVQPVQLFFQERMMQRRATEEINNLLKKECSRLVGMKDNRAKLDRPFRKPAIYRSVGIKIPGNGSVMVVHVREY
jgi:hypothetical protein